MILGQTNPWLHDGIAVGGTQGRWTSWSPSGEASAQGASTTCAQRLEHEPMQSSSLGAAGTARAGAGGSSVLQHQAPPLLLGNSLFRNTHLSPAHGGQRPCHAEAPSHHRDGHHHGPPPISVLSHCPDQILGGFRSDPRGRDRDTNEVRCPTTRHAWFQQTLTEGGTRRHQREDSRGRREAQT